MINALVNLLLLQVVITYGIDVSGFGMEVKRLIFKWLLFPKYSMDRIPEKPFFCSLCLTWWLGLILLLIEGQFNLPMLAILCLISYLAPITADLMILMKDLLIKILDGLRRLFNI